jgi:hypothetical protein
MMPKNTKGKPYALYFKQDQKWGFSVRHFFVVNTRCPELTPYVGANVLVNLWLLSNSFSFWVSPVSRLMSPSTDRARLIAIVPALIGQVPKQSKPCWQQAPSSASKF